MVESVRRWLQELDLSKYLSVFEANEIGLEDIPHLAEDDLKELGLPLGPRKRILHAIQGMSDRRPNRAQESVDASPLQAERRLLTVIFVDLVGSTDLSDKLDPEDLREVMGRYQDAVTGAVARYGGHVAKYLGDGVLAYFGWPHAHEDQAERAVRAGLDSVAAVGAIDLSADVRLSARAGIATGQVVVGDLVGAAGRDAEAVSGATPNLAARLQGVVQAGQVAVAESTRRLIGETFELEDLGSIALKGFAEPMAVWRPIRERSTASRFESAHGAGMTRLIGREHELGLLRDRWRRAKSGEGQVVLLSGGAGIGKSRLVQALREGIGSEQHARLRYQCSPYHSNSVLYPVIRQLTRAAGISSEDDVVAKLDKLERTLGGAGARSAETMALLAELLSLPAVLRGRPLELTPQQRKTKTLEALIAQLRESAAREPVLFVVEDAHWIDPTTQELLDQVVAEIESMSVLLMITHRPEYQPSFASQPQVSALALNRLGRDEVAEMIRAVAGVEAERIVGPVMARAEGIPLFVEELTKSAVEASLESTADALEVPESLQASLLARLDRLGEAKQFAQVGAVIGREFTYDLLSAVIDSPAAELTTGLERLVASQLVFRRGQPPDVCYTFKHALVQDAAYDSLLRGRRQALHRRIAEVLEARFPEIERNEPEILAHHFTEAALIEKALSYWRAAGGRASSRSATVEAEAHIRRGLALVKEMPPGADQGEAELELLLLLGPLLMVNHDWASSEIGNVYARADELCRRLDDRERAFTTAWGLWSHKQQINQVEAAIAIADRLLEIAKNEGDEEHTLQAHHSAWTSRFAYEELDSVIHHTEQGLRLYDKDRHHPHSIRYGGHDPGVCCRILGGMARLIAGAPAQGRTLTMNSVELARELDHPFSLALALSFSGTSHLLLDEAEQVAARMNELSKVIDVHGFAPIKPNMDLLRGWARVVIDGDREAIGAMEEGLAQLEKSGLRRLSFQLYVLADAYRRVGQAESALRATDRAIKVVEETDERRWEAEIYRLKAVLLEAGRNDAEAEPCHRRALQIARKQGAKWFELRAASNLARYLGERANQSEARRILTPIYDQFSEGFDTSSAIHARAVLDGLH